MYVFVFVQLSFWMYDELTLVNGVRKATATGIYESLMTVRNCAMHVPWHNTIHTLHYMLVCQH